MQATALPAEETLPSEAMTGAPLISGAPELLWSGAAAVVVIFIAVFWLLVRWKAAQRARDGRRSGNFFQPAGADAEISFDETPPSEAPLPDRAHGVDIPEEVFADPPPKKKRGPFAGVFSKRGKEPADDTDDAPDAIEIAAEDDHYASVRIAREEPPATDFPATDFPATDLPATDWAAIERAELARAASDARRYEEEEADRLRAQTDADRRRLAADVAEIGRAAPEAPRFAEADGRAAHDDLVRTLSEVEEALHVQREAIQAETRSLLDSFARRFSERLESLAASVEQRQAQHVADASLARSDRSEAAGVLDAVARRIDEHQEAMARSIASLSKRIDAISVAPGDVATLRDELARLRLSLAGPSAGHAPAARAAPFAPAIQLADIVRDALAPDAYEFNAVLANNRRADCLLRLGRASAPIAIDAHFPVEAFDALAGGGPDAETAFRRAALRQIVGIAERLIVPGATAGSALLFLPSEAMAAELHARFPDVVQDSYRARVFIVSPTTLMATLHTLSGVLGEAGRPRAAASGEAQRALAEIERLSARIAALEAAAAPRRPVTAAEGPSEQTYWRGGPVGDEPAERRLKLASYDDDVAPVGDLYTDDHAFDGGRRTDEADRTAPARPLFPLR